MYRILIIDQSQEVSVHNTKADHDYRVPSIGEHVLVKWQNQTKVCEVEDVWTHVNLDQNPPYQGAVQVIVRWAKGLDPALYVRRFRS